MTTVFFPLIRDIADFYHITRSSSPEVFSPACVWSFWVGQGRGQRISPLKSYTWCPDFQLQEISRNQSEWATAYHSMKFSGASLSLFNPSPPGWAAPPGPRSTTRLLPTPGPLLSPPRVLRSVPLQGSFSCVCRPLVS